MEREREHDPVPTSMLPLAMDGWKTSATARTLLPLVLVSHYPHQHKLTKYALAITSKELTLYFIFPNRRKAVEKLARKAMPRVFWLMNYQTVFTLFSLSLPLHVLPSLHRHAIILKATAYIRCPSNPPKKKSPPHKSRFHERFNLCIVYLTRTPRPPTP